MNSIDLTKLLNKFNSKEGYKVNIGSGFYIQEGYIGIDNCVGFSAQIPENGRYPDIIMDLNLKWPFENNTCKEIYSSHSFEHFTNIDHILKEAARVLKLGNYFKIIVPYANSAEGMYPGHNIFFTEKWFYNNITVNSLFEIDFVQFKQTDEFKEIPDNHPIKQSFPFDFARKFLFNVCNEMEIHLKKK